MNRWNQTKTARILGIQRTYLSRLIKELEISH
jgi:DNA-binding NtrC family response regulator